MDKNDLLLYAVTDRSWLPEGETLEEQVEKCLKAVQIPVVAIGGITEENVAELAGNGICGVAVVSAIFAKKDIEAATRELKKRTEEMVKA